MFICWSVNLTFAKTLLKNETSGTSPMRSFERITNGMHAMRESGQRPIQDQSLLLHVPSARWNVKQKGLILNRTTGYRALMQFLPLVIL